MGRIYSATFSAVSVSAAQDLFEVNTSATRPVVIHGVVIGQYSEAGDSQDELLSITLVRGNTVSGSGGSSATAAPLNAGDSAFGGTVEVNNTTVANTGSPVTVHADSFNVRAGWIWLPTPELRPIVDVSSRIVVRITAPADAITCNGTIYLEEI